MNPLIQLKKAIPPSGFSSLRAFMALLLCTVAAGSMLTGTMLAVFRPDAPAKVPNTTLTFADRVAYQRAIEEVYWRHRIWPKERPDPKPSLDEIIPPAQLEKKVMDSLRNSQALENYWQRPLTAEQLQAEMERMAQHTRQPEVLRELFKALGNDPFVIAECLAKPVLSERLVTNFYLYDQRFHAEPMQLAEAQHQVPIAMAAVTTNYTLPVIASPLGTCTDDTWTPTSTTNAPDARMLHTAVWTGSEMIVWGGQDINGNYSNTGGRYDPSTDSWIATSTTGAPSPRGYHTAVWTGSEMIVWGGADANSAFNTGGRYNPSTDNWTATSTTNVPSARYFHTAVWTGSEMIVWGGQDVNGNYSNTGGRYDPSTDSWTATSITNARNARVLHTAVWTGSEMIVWGGQDINGNYSNTGGRYDPSTDSWTATSITNAPDGRISHTAVWTATEMIVWGGANGNTGGVFDTGGRYTPGTNSWTATSTTNVPSARYFHSAVWTGSEMIVWGGYDNNITYFNTGGRYDPGTDTWTATSTINAPSDRALHTAVRTDTEMIVWGGYVPGNVFNTGGRYCAQSGATPTPTPTVTPTPTPTATATKTPSPSPIATATSTPTAAPRSTPTPRPRPTPHPRPTP